MTGDADSIGGDGRDGAGRFAPGNRFGRGNPHLARLASLQGAVRDAIGPDDLQAVLRKLRDAAAAGDVQAARLLLERTLGRPREAAPEHLELELPDLSTAAGCAEASATIARAAAAGAIPADVAVHLSALVDRALAAGAVRDVERRLAQLESQR